MEKDAAVKQYNIEEYTNSEDSDGTEPETDKLIIKEFEKVLKNEDLVGLGSLPGRASQRYVTTNINLDNLIEVCSRKIAAEATNRKALFIRASTYLKQGRYYDSLEDCNKLIQVDPHYAGAYYIRGCAHEKLNEFQKALDDYSTVLRIDPFHVNAVFARGACLNKMVGLSHQGEFQRAIDDYRDALKRDELKQKISLKRVAVRRSQAKMADLESYQSFFPENHSEFIRYEEAEFAAVKRTQPVQPAPASSNSYIHVAFGSKKFKNMHLTRDLEEIKEVDDVQLADSLHDKGYKARQKGDYAKAVSYYSQALEVCPNHHRVPAAHQCLFNRGYAYDKLGLFDEAIEDYLESLRHMPDNAFAYYNL